MQIRKSTVASCRTCCQWVAMSRCRHRVCSCSRPSTTSTNTSTRPTIISTRHHRTVITTSSCKALTTSSSSSSNNNSSSSSRSSSTTLITNSSSSRMPSPCRFYPAPSGHHLSQSPLHTQSVGSQSDISVDIASTSQRAHVCTTCLKGFRSKQQLAQHSLVHSNIRKYTCTYCERAFKQLSHLQQHTRIHTGEQSSEKNEERRYSCSYCERAFKQLTHLQQHTRLHTGEKPYSCKMEGCERAFAQLSNLQHHMRNHEDQVKKEATRIHKCLICHRSYTNESSLRAHTLKMHIHIKQVTEDGQASEAPPVKKRKKKKQKLYTVPSMVPLSSSHDNHDRAGTNAKKQTSESSSDDDLIIIGEKNEKEDEARIAGMPRTLVESLNYYERSLTGRNLQDANVSSSSQFGSQQSGSLGSGNEGSGLRGSRFDPGRAGSLGLHNLMTLSGMETSVMSGQHPEMIERAAAAAAAAVSSQIHNLSSHGHTGSSTSDGGVLASHGHSQTPHSQLTSKSSNNGGGNSDMAPTRSPTPTGPLHPLDMVGMGGAQYGSQNPYVSASQIMEAHLRSQLPPMGLQVVHDQYPAHSSTPLSSVSALSHHARFLSPRGMGELSMPYGSHISTASSLHSSTATSSHMSLSTIQHGSNRSPTLIGSPQHVSESLNFSS
ncbi:zinc finger protein GLIS2-like isoform X2 [Pomacea canaliculata]|uniref:zinc finger protein GLIS2-like isoform X2 n=1 Tax=Pomacea canaliculata TaxID=400727 RepID=UPI000D72870E|nr:zinc finger protein GLIS2-like isoform X2 [Pomacea canaliculata]